MNVNDVNHRNKEKFQIKHNRASKVAEVNRAE